MFRLALVPKGLKRRLSHCLQQSEVRTVTLISQHKADVVIAWPDTHFGIINCLGKEIVTSTDLGNRYLAATTIVAVDGKDSVVTFEKSDCPPLRPSE